MQTPRVKEDISVRYGRQKCVIVSEQHGSRSAVVHKAKVMSSFHHLGGHSLCYFFNMYLVDELLQ
jgi:hypothetical protein